MRLDSEIGTVDARLETRLANVEKAFQEVFWMNEPTRLQADKVVEMVERLPVCHLKGKISKPLA